MGVRFQYVVLLVVMRVRDAWKFIQFYSRCSSLSPVEKLDITSSSAHICTYQLQMFELNLIFYFACEAAYTLDIYIYRSAIFSHQNQFATKIFKIWSFTLNPIWIFGLELCQCNAVKKLNRIQKFELKKNQRNENSVVTISNQKII